MRVESIQLINFRNIKSCVFKPEEKLNFFIGNNGQGKTSFLEALSFLSSLRSFRGAKTEEVIQWGEKKSEISCCLVSDRNEILNWKTEFKISFSTQEREQKGGKASKTAFINQKPFRSSTQYIRSRFGSWELGFHTISFNPSDHDLIKGDPALRRAYLDRILASEDSDYLESLQKYQRALQQKNELLKSQKTGIQELLFEFSETLCRHGSLMTQKRINWINCLNSISPFYLQKIAPQHQPVLMRYSSKWVEGAGSLLVDNKSLNQTHFTGQGVTPSLKLIETAFRSQLSFYEQKERQLQVSLVGPHRDDWMFLLDGHSLKARGSQGEARTALLTLKLSEIELFRTRTGHRPVLLLDDFSSELDNQRRKFLLKFLEETDLQVFITSTDKIFMGGPYFWVRSGALFNKETEEFI